MIKTLSADHSGYNKKRLTDAWKLMFSVVLFIMMYVVYHIIYFYLFISYSFGSSVSLHIISLSYTSPLIQEPQTASITLPPSIFPYGINSGSRGMTRPETLLRPRTTSKSQHHSYFSCWKHADTVALMGNGIL